MPVVTYRCWTWSAGLRPGLQIRGCKSGTADPGLQIANLGPPCAGHHCVPKFANLQLKTISCETTKQHRHTHVLQYQRPAQGQHGSDQALELGRQASNAAAGPRCDGQPATRPHDRTARAARIRARAARGRAGRDFSSKLAWLDSHRIRHTWANESVKSSQVK